MTVVRQNNGPILGAGDFIVLSTMCSLFLHDPIFERSPKCVESGANLKHYFAAN